MDLHVGIIFLLAHYILSILLVVILLIRVYDHLVLLRWTSTVTMLGKIYQKVLSVLQDRGLQRTDSLLLWTWADHIVAY